MPSNRISCLGPAGFSWLLTALAPALISGCNPVPSIRCDTDSSASPKPAVNARNAPVAPDDGESAEGTGDTATEAEAEPEVPDLTQDPRCDGDATQLPSWLSCTGLYAEMDSKALAKGVRAFSPSTPLWSDGAHKERWIWIPPGETIDASDEADWVFPVGTRAWKQFQVDGKRIETRLFQKVREDRWMFATYVWDDTDSDAQAQFGTRIPLANAVYEIPTRDNCEDCHKGRKERLLGFDSISLGLEGSKGLTLAKLAEEELLSPAPEITEHTMPDDGTGLLAPALAAMHVNCGVSCHNGSANAIADGTGLHLRLDPAMLRDVVPAMLPAIETTVGVPAKNKSLGAQVRIVPGKPDDSLLVHLMSTRTANQKGQMPPLASRVVDEESVAKVRAWVSALQ
jgi:hypothetical protein